MPSPPMPSPPMHGPPMHGPPMHSPLAKKPILRRPRAVPEAEMDITPMIDVTFLLLIFFLVASRMNVDTTVALPKARHGTAVVVRESIILTVASHGDEVKVYRGDSVDPQDAIEAPSLAEQEDAIAAYVEQESAAATPPKRYVLIKAAGAAKHRDVARVARAASQAEVEQLYVAVLERQ
jgi:biopolymer transport protein TolR